MPLPLCRTQSSLRDMRVPTQLSLVWPQLSRPCHLLWLHHVVLPRILTLIGVVSSLLFVVGKGAASLCADSYVALDVAAAQDETDTCCDVCEFTADTSVGGCMAVLHSESVSRGLGVLTIFHGIRIAFFALPFLGYALYQFSKERGQLFAEFQHAIAELRHEGYGAPLVSLFVATLLTMPTVASVALLAMQLDASRAPSDACPNTMCNERLAAQQDWQECNARVLLGWMPVECVGLLCYMAGWLLVLWIKRTRTSSLDAWLRNVDDVAAVEIRRHQQRTSTQLRARTPPTARVDVEAPAPMPALAARGGENTASSGDAPRSTRHGKTPAHEGHSPHVSFASGTIDSGADAESEGAAAAHTPSRMRVVVLVKTIDPHDGTLRTEALIVPMGYEETVGALLHKARQRSSTLPIPTGGEGEEVGAFLVMRGELSRLWSDDAVCDVITASGESVIVCATAHTGVIADEL